MPTPPYPSPPGELPGGLAHGLPCQDGVHQLLELLVAPQQLPELRPDVGAADRALGRHRLRAAGAAVGGSVQPRGAQQRPQLVQLETGRGKRLPAGLLLAPKPPQEVPGGRGHQGGRGTERSPPWLSTCSCRCPAVVATSCSSVVLAASCCSLSSLSSLLSSCSRDLGGKTGCGGAWPLTGGPLAPKPSCSPLTPSCHQVSPLLQPTPAL